MYSVLNSPQKVSSAYAQSVYGPSLPSVFVSLAGRTPQLWEYISGDSIGVVQSSNYFSNGGFLGMSAGDVIFVRKTPEDSVAAITVTVANPGGTATAAANFDRFNSDVIGNITGLTGPSGSIPLSLPNFNYHFHGFAGNQMVGDPQFYDMSGLGNHGSFGANLSVSAAWANLAAEGVVSTVDPVGGSTDSVIRIPAVNFNYSAGEVLVVWWLGKVTDEGADSSFLGCGTGTNPGVRVKTNGTNFAEVDVSDASGTGFGAATNVVVSDGALHEFAFAFDGRNRKYLYYIDGAIQSTFNNNWANFNVASTYATGNTNTWQIGSALPAASVSTDGTATKTRAFVILHFPSTYPVPTAAQLVTIFKTLRANPARLLNSSAI